MNFQHPISSQAQDDEAGHLTTISHGFQLRGSSEMYSLRPQSDAESALPAVRPGQSQNLSQTQDAKGSTSIAKYRDFQLCVSGERFDLHGGQAQHQHFHLR